MPQDSASYALGLPMFGFRPTKPEPESHGLDLADFCRGGSSEDIRLMDKILHYPL